MYKKVLYLLSTLLFISSVSLKQYWLLEKLEMNYSNELHLWMTIGTSLLILVPCILVSGKHYITALAVVDFILSFLLLSDLIYYRYFGDFISIPVLAQSGQLVDIKDSVINLIPFQYLWIFSTMVFWCLFYYFIKKPGNDSSINLKMRTVFSLLTLLIGIASFSIPLNKYIEKHSDNIFVQSYSNASIYRVIGIIGFHGFDIKKYIEENYLNKDRLSSEEIHDIKQWFHKNNHDNSLTNEYGISKDSNIIVFQFESLQKFVIGKEINGKEITPNLNRLLETSYYFDNIYDQTAQGRTSDAEILVNASLHPLPSGSVHVRFPNNQFDSLAGNLKQHGYQSFSFHGNNKSFWNRYLIHSNLGFNKFYSLEELQDDERLGPYLSDRSLLSQTASVLQDVKQPFYSFVVGVTSHHPFTFVAQTDLDLGEYNGTTLGRYIKSIHYVDQQLGEFIQELKKKNMWNHTTLVIYGDHNAEIFSGSHEMPKFLGLNSDSLEYQLEDKKIPLILHTPSQASGKTINKVGGLIDVSPTLFHFMGLPKPEYMMGKSLLTKSDEFVVFRNGGFVTDKLYFDNTDGESRCFNLIEEKATLLNNCKDAMPEYHQYLDVSDTVIRNNLIKEMKKAAQ